MQPGSDWQLIEQSRNGSEAAFAELVHRYQTPVIHFCMRMTGSREDAEDIAQEAFVRVYRHLGRLKPQAQFSTVLFGIARNLTLNAIRDRGRKGRDRTRPMARPDGSHWDAADARPGPDGEARGHEADRLLQQALGRLPEKHREVLVLREINGLDYEEIARAVGVRKGTVKSRLARAREQLRAELTTLAGDAGI
jgi:RNA polymerase sigma-70 factor (ECF subfamily)